MTNDQHEVIGQVFSCDALTCAWNNDGKCGTGPISIDRQGVCLDFDILTPEEEKALIGIG